jgi:hypothetical protein
MPTNVTINNITGSSPFDIYLSGNPSSTYIYISTETTFPYSFDVPPILEGFSTYKLKVIDDNGCTVITILTL